VNRLLATFGLGVALAGCTGGAPASERAPSPLVRTASPTSSPTTFPTPTAPFPVAWSNGLVAYPRGSSNSPLPYVEYLPPRYGDGSPRPLLVYLHGVDEHANGSESSLRDILTLGVPYLIAEGSWPLERPFVILMPQEPAAKSNQCDFGPEVVRFLDFAVDRYAIDKTRIYLTGISCGAIGAWDYLAQQDDPVVAAVVPISGHPDWAMEKAGCAVLRTAIWDFQGALDDIIPIDWLKGRIEELRSCTDPQPGEIHLTVYPDADHDAWSRTYDLSAGHDVFAWMLQHTRP
jgi:hypothetical protein